MRGFRRRLLRLKQVEDRTGYKKSKIYKDVKEGKFPAPVKLGSISVAWVEEEVQQWIDARPRVEV